jgi:hypothetical protein
MATRNVEYVGVTFESVRLALFNMYFYYDGMPQEEIDAAMAHIVPMQHNFENPLQKLGAKDTFIEYWIARDERMTQDYVSSTGGVGENATHKLAVVDIRFVGEEAELWAKAFHHITKRENVWQIFMEICQGSILEHVGDLIPVNIDYFGVGNSSIAFDLTIKIEYKESVELSWKPLEYISLAPGVAVSGGVTEL